MFIQAFRRSCLFLFGTASIVIPISSTLSKQKQDILHLILISHQIKYMRGRQRRMEIHQIKKNSLKNKRKRHNMWKKESVTHLWRSTAELLSNSLAGWQRCAVFSSLAGNLCSFSDHKWRVCPNLLANTVFVVIDFVVCVSQWRPFDVSYELSVFIAVLYTENIPRKILFSHVF